LKKADVIIIGSGIAALQMAHHINSNKNVMILTKSNIKDSNSSLAQGGIAASVGKNDHFYYHSKDTMDAGRYHNNEEVVFKITKEAPQLITDLRQKGFSFDEDRLGQMLLGMEGAHSRNRIVHSGGDATGKHVIDFLVDTLKNNISVIEDIFVYELIINEKQQCIGVKGKDSVGNIQYYFSDHTVIATGGCGYLYSLTSNNPNVTGDGIAMAYLAGAEITDIEFIQFHPTMLVKNGQICGLISEAVRGQGAILKTKNGKAIMDDIHPLKDLAPRHIVSQTIFEYLQNGEEIFLDITMIENFSKKFPSITALCIQNDIDLKAGMIPVVPGSHFLMGGVKVDMNCQTNIAGLYAIGEAACTGLHGANRLASNSLLEGMYFGKRLAEHINLSTTSNEGIQFPLKSKRPILMPLSFPDKNELRRTMMEQVGIVRNREGLQWQKDWLEGFVHLEQDFGAFDNLSASEIQSTLECLTSLLITTAALERTESRGGHFRSDFPLENDDHWQNKQLIYQYGKGRFEEDEQTKVTSYARAVFS
jgi:L-aspartate oxidase